ncbi:MAG: DUF853 family protein [Sandaracinaceae bacterium]|nr:DUF853 family protein [Sandaracinaceae bacterium]
MSELWLGSDASGERVALPATALLRHVMALGSSGSGKTVFCKVLVEAAAHEGIPAICVDPQGDLCSFAAGTLDDDELRERGVDPALAAALRERLEVVIFTPGAPRGVPLSADPIDPGLSALDGEARVGAITRAASVVVGLLGFDLESDDGAGLAAVVDRALHGIERPTLAALADHLAAAGEGGFAAYARYLDPKKIRVACQRLARLDVGARRLLFHDGVPVDVDVLLGRDPRAPVAAGKTRVAVVYLNTLHSQEDKDFFVAALADRLYSWMLAHPSPAPQALFYIDEVAPFIPPVRKPACKDGLSLLFKQARKYGLGCVMATQNPGDVDYRAMAQFGTWALGRLTTRQDLKKVEPTLKSLAPVQADAIAGRLPSLAPGELVLICPDAFPAPVELRTRWLVTRHQTWTEDRIEAETDPLRDRFDPLRSDTPPAPANPTPPPAPAKPEHAPPLPLSSPPTPNLDHEEDDETDPDDDDPAPPAPGLPAPGLPAPDPSTPSLPIEGQVRAALLDLPSATVRELADHTGRSASAIRRALGRLLAADAIRELPSGRAQRYWSPDSGGRPDLGMPPTLSVFVANLDAADAARIAKQHARAKVLGVLGEEDRFERVEAQHRLLYALAFEERVERPLLSRLFGDAHDHRVGRVYVHPHNLGVVVFDNERGLRFEDRPSSPASEIRDLDGVAERVERRPVELAFEEADWTGRASEEAVRASFRERFQAIPGAIEPVFVPLWTLYFVTEAGARRKAQIDALVGRPVRWLPPDQGSTKKRP